MILLLKYFVQILKILEYLWKILKYFKKILKRYYNAICKVNINYKKKKKKKTSCYTVYDKMNNIHLPKDV